MSTPNAFDLLLNAYIEGDLALHGHEKHIVRLVNGIRLFSRSDDVGVAELALKSVVGIALKLGTEHHRFQRSEAHDAPSPRPALLSAASMRLA